MNSIYKTKTGKYIDLSKIVAIGDVSSNGTDCFFKVDCQLMENPSLFKIPCIKSAEDKWIIGNELMPIAEEYRNDLVAAWERYVNDEAKDPSIRAVKLFEFPGEIKCDGCGCRPGAVYITDNGSYCIDCMKW